MREVTVALGPLALADGSRLPSVEQRVTIYGSPRPDGSNVILVAHALTGSSRVAQWWPEIVGCARLFDPAERCIVGINVLGGCYGSTGPLSHAPFPRITVADIVSAQECALYALGIENIACVIGGSLGGMQALQWALHAPERVGEAIIVAAHDHHSAMSVAFNAIQRECLELDPIRGLRTARKLAMLTYNSEALLNERHGRSLDRLSPTRFDIEGYLEHQANKFYERMDATTYAALTHVMDAFDVRDSQCPGRGGKLTFVGISSGWLFRAQDVRNAAERFAARGWDATCIEFRSNHGHDAFLAEAGALADLLRDAMSPATITH